MQFAGGEQIAPQDGAAEPFNREGYAPIEDNPFINTLDDPRSTFSIDVDTASYANVRRYLKGGSLPPKSAVRIEEMINYFDYDYPAPKGDEPFSVTLEVADAPWAEGHKLVRVGLRGKDIARGEAPPSNLVFLIDVSGSMGDYNKLPLLKESLHLLVKSLDHKDTISLVTYAGSAGVVLPPTPAYKKNEIHSAIDRLGAGGSTNGAAGIHTAYELAQWAFIENGNNRVLLATDGDFNVGTSSEGELVRIIEDKAKTGVFLSVLGFGMGNYQDAMLEAISNRGNGNYAYIDTLDEAKKVLVEERYGTLHTIAKDVKIQIEMNPLKVSAFRLLGYENRVLAHRDFNDDKKDAGDIGAGHTVTALYELVPSHLEEKGKEALVDPLKYQGARHLTAAADSNELMTVRLRYKRPHEDKSHLISAMAVDDPVEMRAMSADFRFAAAVAAFGMLLRDSPHKGTATKNTVLSLAEAAVRQDKKGYRAEFVELVRNARSL